MAEQQEVGHIKTGAGELKPISAEQMRERAKKALKPSEAPLNSKGDPIDKGAATVDKDGKLNNKPAESKVGDEGKPPVVEPKLDKDGKPVVEAKLDADGKPIAEPAPAKKTLRDPSSLLKKKDVIVEPDAIPEPFKLQLSAKDKQISELTERLKILDNPDIQTVLEASKAGKRAWDLFEEAKGDAINTNKMTDAQLYEYELKKAGVKMSSELDKDSEETSFEEEMQKFKDMPLSARKREAELIKAKINEEQSTKSETFLSKLRDENSKADTTSAKDRAERIEKANRTQTELNELADAFVGQEYAYVVGEPDMAQSIKNFNLSDYLLNKDGSLDANKLFDITHHILFGSLGEDALSKKIASEKFLEYKAEVEVTGGTSAGNARTPVSKQTNKSDEDLHKEAHSKMRPVSVGHPSIRH